MKKRRYNGHKMYNRFDMSGRQIWLDDVRCNGTEADIDGCSHSDWGVHDCLHREDVAVSCYPWTERNGMFSESQPSHSLNHVLLLLLPDKTDHHYYLRARRHDRQLLDKRNILNYSNNFMIRMLYTDGC